MQAASLLQSVDVHYVVETFADPEPEGLSRTYGPVDSVRRGRVVDYVDGAKVVSYGSLREV